MFQQFHKTYLLNAANVENTPFEVAIPSYGISIRPQDWGSQWNNGIITRKCEEFPMHVLLGAAGSAFAINMNEYKNKGLEESNDFISVVG